jgi:transcriptional regulator with XRE-family HTH domain
MEYILNYAAIGIRIRNMRLKMNLTQEKLSETIGIGIQHLSKIENGKAQLSLTCLVSIANALKTTTDFLLTDNVDILKSQHQEENESFIGDCSPVETIIILKLVKTLKDSLRQCKLT